MWAVGVLLSTRSEQSIISAVWKLDRRIDELGFAKGKEELL